MTDKTHVHEPLCQAVVIRCMDYRLVEPTARYFADIGMRGCYDEVAIAGGTKRLLDTHSSDCAFLLGQIESARALHKVKECYLINHLDCGAYGGHHAFTTIEDERARHWNDLHDAAEVVRHDQKVGGAIVHCLLAIIGDDGSVTFEADHGSPRLR